MKLNMGTPEGTRDRLFSECLERRQVQRALVELFRARGFDEVITPAVEYYDLFVCSGNPLPQESMLKIVDRSGKILVMRPDSTAPIARVAAARLKGRALPQRLYYDQTVFRSGKAHDGCNSEIAQCGVELVGASGLRADLEMIALAVDSLYSSGLKEFHIELGHADLFPVLTERLSMSEEKKEILRSCIEEKNYALLNDLLAEYQGDPCSAPLYRLPYLFGGAEVLDEVEALAGRVDCIDYLRALYEKLSMAGYGDRVRFDLGLVHQIDYYTGVIFRAYAEGAGSPVLSGGRYDQLIGKFGYQTAAIGFAVDVDVVAGCITTVVPALKTVIYYEPDQFLRALRCMNEKEPGTCELSCCDSPEAALLLAREKGAAELIMMEQEGERRIDL